jgi:hypothetical protein
MGCKMPFKDPQKYNKYHKEYKKKYRIKNYDKLYGQRRQYQLKTAELHRFRIALWMSKGLAKRHKYVPCVATEDEIATSFTGYCHACGKAESENRRRLSLDHCHVTGQFRGWLCSFCNFALGHTEDSPELLEGLIAYLKATETEPLLPAPPKTV